VILFSPKYWLSPIAKVFAAGGMPVAVTTFDPAHEYTHRFPQFMPDGRHFLYVSRVRPDATGFARGQIIGASLDSSDRKLVIDNGSNPMYVPPRSLLFVREHSIMVAPFDARQMRITGDAVALPVGRVGSYENRNYGFYTASQNGTLAFLPPNTPPVQLHWFDRKGNAIASEEQAGYYNSAALSRDGRRLAFVRSDDALLAHTDLWLHEIGGQSSSRLTFDGHHEFVRFSADGKRIYYNSEKKGVYDLYRRSLAGGADEESLYASSQWKDDFDVSPDEKYVVTDEQYPETEYDLMTIEVSTHRASAFLRTPTNDMRPSFSPDGKWVVFESDSRIYMRRFPDTGEQWQVSSGAGSYPRWSGDGTAIFYQARDGMITSVALRFGDSVQAATPSPLFRVNATAMPDGGTSPFLAVSSDGQRFLIATPTEQSTTLPFEVVLNWPAMLQKK
jgi:hypothetical protein